MRPVHPGEVLREDCLAPLGMSVNALAVALGVPATRSHEIVKERRAITADTATRLGRYFGGEPASGRVNATVPANRVAAGCQPSRPTPHTVQVGSARFMLSLIGMSRATRRRTRGGCESLPEPTPAMFDFMEKQFELPTDAERAKAIVFSSD